MFLRDPQHKADIQEVEPDKPVNEDEAKMQEILANPEIRNILLDPRIQKLIETLRTDPNKAQR